ncbi:hypothetical protein QQS19_33785, partial [Pseudomonas aeruginosa]|uniref:hypothetical protein n=1 Tax=Pseudomonas aeruginosa TaxID=287 RepID=UPI002B23A6CD
SLSEVKERTEIKYGNGKKESVLDRRKLTLPNVTMNLMARNSLDRPPPPSLEEVEQNITLYLQMLHDRLVALAGPKVDPIDIVDTFM